VGRIVWGKLADKINFKNTMVIMMMVQGVLLFVYFTSSANFPVYLLLTGLLMFCFGGNLSLFPTGTSDLFGRKKMGQNYGVVFSAYGAAGFIGAVAVNQIVLVFGGYLTLYVFLGVLSIIAAILAFAVGIFVKKSQQT
jgi:OFA family oxalate/formate antiporter-like MFS transporter